MGEAITTGRKFDPTFYGLHTNQQILVMSLLFLELFIFMIGYRLFPMDTVHKICLVFGVFEIGFGYYIGKSQQRLYYFECFWRFVFSLASGSSYIEKFGKDGLKKARDFSYFKWCHKGGFIEYFYDPKKRTHNWGMIINLNAFDPESLQSFLLEVQRMLMGLEDKIVLKTTVQIREQLQDFAEPITIMLQNNDMPEIVRESMMEHEKLIKMAQIKNYENYMLVLLDYTASKKKAMKRLSIIVNSIREVLKSMDIENQLLENVEEVREVFFSQITTNLHLSRKVSDDVII